MPISVVMPALEMAQETGKLVSWLKKEGERVAKGEMLLEVETDKAVMEIEAPGDGVLAGITAQPGTEIPVGQTIAWIVQPGEAAPTDTTQPPSGRHVTVDAAGKTAIAAATPAESAELRISPRARRLAKEQGIDLAKVKGSGPGGEIHAADVVAAAPTIATNSAVTTIAKLMAKRVAEAWTTVPHFFVVREADAGALNSAREQLQGEIGLSHKTKLTITDLLVAAVARTLVRHPEMNASWIDGSVQNNPEINISVAVAVESGVVAPVIHKANRLSLGEIASLRHQLSQRARAGRLRPADVTGGTFTLSNLGMFDVDEFTAIITPPQAAVLAVGRIADRVVVIGGEPVVRPMMKITLSSDHRVLDGTRAAMFMRDLVNDISASNLAS
jgi:pyruvate dehydrogenase E2 component (dihydrolipoamide acetyltransferase)